MMELSDTFCITGTMHMSTSSDFYNYFEDGLE